MSRITHVREAYTPCSCVVYTAFCAMIDLVAADVWLQMGDRLHQFFREDVAAHELTLVVSLFPPEKFHQRSTKFSAISSRWSANPISQLRRLSQGAPFSLRKSSRLCRKALRKHMGILSTDGESERGWPVQPLDGRKAGLRMSMTA